MPNRQLDVYLDGNLAGVAQMSSNGALTFLYDDSYAARTNPTPLSLSMPVDVKAHKNRVVLPFIQGLLPDNAQALAAIASTYSVSAASPFAMLEHVGKDVAGALQFVPHGASSPDAVETRSRVAELTDEQIEEKLNEAISEYRDGKPVTQADGRFSLAGAQPKIALHELASGRWALPEDATPTTHIFKPNAGEMKDIDVIEQMTMNAARLLGLNVSESYVRNFGDVSTFVSKRYDRVFSGGRWHRLHQEDLCQALGVTPAKKYQRTEGGPGVGDFATLTERFPIASDRREASGEFFAAFVFNVVIGGTDAHAKNYSLLLENETVALAPLYDLATYAPYRTDDEVVLLPMNVNGKYRSDAISTADLVKVGARLRVPTDQAVAIVDRMRNGAVTAFAEAGEEFGENQSARVVASAVVEAIRKLPLCVDAAV
ncbi:type II toxin-antitoxin system HipA family toxin [Salinibacterium sp. M195]|uniref:type II toxin-antitoxin system HipA family toxin n=1 Tax=Salinibacterium sp. M195 TaxID=2583374 RepID=UPI001C63A3DC|nr:type II toxin-antitoxin system HipA family toxin [Salinibacterium sp. M195]QYH35291.1 type II toxin-antitoxin system HipA family toxin [Salinibacterium sp. M195]